MFYKAIKKLDVQPTFLIIYEIITCFHVRMLTFVKVVRRNILEGAVLDFRH